MTFFVEKGLVQKIKRMMNEQNNSFREIKIMIVIKNFKKLYFFTKRMNLQTFFEMGRSQTINKRNGKN